MRTLTTLMMAVASVQAAPLTCWSGGPTYDLSYDAAKAAIKIVATVPENMYISIGWGVGMNNVDMVLFKGSGADGVITDLWSTSESTPQTDSSQDYIDSVKSKSGTTYTFTTYRKMDTGDSSQDTVLSCGKTYRFDWAGLSTSSTFMEHDKDG